MPPLFHPGTNRHLEPATLDEFEGFGYAKETDDGRVVGIFVSHNVSYGGFGESLRSAWTYTGEVERGGVKSVEEIQVDVPRQQTGLAGHEFNFVGITEDAEGTDDQQSTA